MIQRTLKKMPAIKKKVDNTRFIINFLYNIAIIGALSCFTLGCEAFASQGQTAKGLTHRIAATVGRMVITQNDVKQRATLMALLSGEDASSSQELLNQAMHSLIEEAKKHVMCQGIDASPEELKAAIENFAKERGMTYVEFKQWLSSKGMNLRTLEDRFASFIKWSHFVEIVNKERNKDHQFSQKEIEAALKEKNNEYQNTSYSLSEIVFASKSDADKAYRELLEHKPFRLLAMQYSVSPSALQGGDIGWFLEKQIVDDDIRKVIISMVPGEFSNPIQTGSKWKIILLKDIESKDKPSLSRISLSLVHIALPKTEDLSTSQEISKILVELKKSKSCDEFIKKAQSFGVQTRQENIPAIRLVEIGQADLLKTSSNGQCFVEKNLGNVCVLTHICKKTIAPKLEWEHKSAVRYLEQKNITAQAFTLGKRMDSVLPVTIVHQPKKA